MARRFSTLFVASLALICTPYAWAQLPAMGQTSSGDKTYYGAGGDSGGTCSHWASNAAALPWYQGVALTVAMNNAQFAGSAACGMCINIDGHGLAMVNNLCPECKSGDLDLAQSGDGRTPVTWTAVPCPGVGNTPLYYATVGSNPQYLKMQVLNARVPPASVNAGGVQLQRTTDGYFMGSGNFGFPLSLVITSVTGDVVTDTLSGLQGGYGTAQFGGGGGGFTAPGNPQPQTSEQSGSNPNAQPDPNSTPAPTDSQPQPDPNTQNPNPQGTVDGSVTEASGTVTTGGNGGSREIQPWQQCGGMSNCGGGNAAFQNPQVDCVDSPWPQAYCGSGASCQKHNEFYWQCTYQPARRLSSRRLLSHE